ncbi:MAG: xylulokinase [Thermoguttaceae bacterium]
MPKILAYDLGTGGNKAALFDENGMCLKTSFVAYDTSYPRSQFHEQKPEDWWRAVIQSTRELLEASGVNPDEIAAIAVSGHSLGVVPIGRDGELLLEQTPIWSDSRAGEEADDFFQKIDRNTWYLNTGCGFPAPHYSLFKIMWLQKHLPEVFAKIDKIIGTKDYVNFKLTGVLATDHSYASGSGAYSLQKCSYDSSFVTAAGVPESVLPAIVASTEILGPILPDVAKQLGLSTKTLVAAGGVDNSCMAAGARAFASGRCYASLGSSSWIAVSSEKPILDTETKPYVFAHVAPGQFASALGLFSTGTTLRWVRDNFCSALASEAATRDINVYEVMMEYAGKSNVGANGLIMNPSLAGGSSFDPSPKLRGAFLGLDLSHTLPDIIRATLEGIAVNMRLLLDSFRKMITLQDMTSLQNEMLVVGGGAISEVWRHIYADAMRISIEKTNVNQNAAALGAAAVAAIGAGIWDSFDKIDAAHNVESVLTPNEQNAAVYDSILQRFENARQFLAGF